MTCRHPEGYHDRDYESQSYSSTPATPDSANFEIVEFARCGDHVVLKVKYPNCALCSYEGHKVLVILNVKEADLIRWRKIDPHFTVPTRSRSRDEAPSPCARFPASPEGWDDALAYARGKVGVRKGLAEWNSRGPENDVR